MLGFQTTCNHGPIDLFIIAALACKKNFSSKYSINLYVFVTTIFSNNTTCVIMATQHDANTTPMFSPSNTYSVYTSLLEKRDRPWCDTRTILRCVAAISFVASFLNEFTNECSSRLAYWTPTLLSRQRLDGLRDPHETLSHLHRIRIVGALVE